MTVKEEDWLTEVLDELATSVHNLSPGDIGSMDRVLLLIQKSRDKISQQHEREIAKAEYIGRHAEVVKALFLMESLGSAFDVQGWLIKRLAELKQQQSNGGKHGL